MKFYITICVRDNVVRVSSVRGDNRLKRRNVDARIRQHRLEQAVSRTYVLQVILTLYRLNFNEIFLKIILALCKINIYLYIMHFTMYVYCKIRCLRF